ncbi:hypothetical protein, partial [Bacillus pseudomycoides]|uniref:hypothetical protein n=2 Tax=Bacillus pseudomycoides TaxID=64104 RepID=UPI00115565D3
YFCTRTENDIISDEQAQKAFTLYTGLHRKPDFKYNSEKIVPNSVDFFKDYIRIMSLRRWILKILPSIDLFSVAGKLPLTRTNDDFEGYINDILSNYVEGLGKINCIIPPEYNLIDGTTLEKAKNLCASIICSIEEYYRGFPDKAFSKLKKGLINNLSISGHFVNNIIIPIAENQLFYKMRIGTDYTYKRDEMFHIPFQLRGKVATNRYSIPGIPCIYLGITPLACWEELNKPDLNTVQTSLFQSYSITYLDLSTPPAVFIQNLIQNYENISKRNMYRDITTYILLWPLMAACSIRVKYKNDTFKPEYIIPQLLLQFIRQTDSIDGISYFSTKIDRYSLEISEVYRNFAFPVQKKQKEGLCPILKDKFEVTDAVPWQMFELYKNSRFCLPYDIEEDKRYEIEFIDGMSLLYTSTDFYKLENFLKSKSTLEKIPDGTKPST